MIQLRLPNTRLCVKCSQAVGGEFEFSYVPENLATAGRLKKNYGSITVKKTAEGGSAERFLRQIANRREGTAMELAYDPSGPKPVLDDLTELSGSGHGSGSVMKAVNRGDVLYHAGHHTPAPGGGRNAPHTKFFVPRSQSVAWRAV